MAEPSPLRADPEPEGADPPSPPRRGPARRWLADPAATFLLVAVVVGSYLAFVVPHFGGIDETAHFSRSYQVSTGRFLPIHPDRSEFSGACLPKAVVRGMLEDGLARLAHSARLDGRQPRPTTPEDLLPGMPACPTDASQKFLAFSTFGSPVPYLPQGLAILIARSVDVGVDGMVLASRLAALIVYVGIVWFAIRRATRSRWAFCAVGIIPVAMFQASASESHDALTIALSLLLVSSALRLVDADVETTLGRALGEAVVVTTLLAACKPGYIVLSACYLLPLLGRRRRSEWWPLVSVPVVGVVASVLWNEAVGGLWRTDADLFGVAVDPGRQRSLLVHEPWTFLGAAVRTVGEDLWDWGKGLITLGPSVAVWPTIAVVAVLVALALVSVQRDAREPKGLDLSQRVLLALVFVVGCLLVLGAQYVYWSVPGADVVGGMQARFFVPLLVLVPIVIGPRRGAWATPTNARVPLVAFVLPLYLALLVSITFRMY